MDLRKSSVEIAENLGVSFQTVCHWLKVWGIDTSYKPYRHPRWKGLNKMITKDGYVQVRGTDGRFRREHRLVMEKNLGRELLPTESVHHIDGNRSNNQPQNLLLVSSAEHFKLSLYCRNCRGRKKRARDYRFPHSQWITGRLVET